MSRAFPSYGCRWEQRVGSASLRGDCRWELGLSKRAVHTFELIMPSRALGWRQLYVSEQDCILCCTMVGEHWLQLPSSLMPSGPITVGRGLGG